MASIARTVRPVGSRILCSSRQPIWQRQSRLKDASCLSGRSVGIRKFSVLGPLEEKRYTKDHEWIELSDDGSTGTIGVSKYAANSLGDVVYVELPTMDLEVNAGDSIGAVESVKSASDIMTPVSGKITGANEGLEVKPSLINQGPEGEGWIAKISVKDKKEIEELMSLEEYRTFTEE